jgi:hypothetical protein
MRLVMIRRGASDWLLWAVQDYDAGPNVAKHGLVLGHGRSRQMAIRKAGDLLETLQSKLATQNGVEDATSASGPWSTDTP